MASPSAQKVCIITGSSSGIGALAAKKMVDLGYYVIMACRDLPKAKIVENQIKQETVKNFFLLLISSATKKLIRLQTKFAKQGKDHIETMLLDLSSFKSVRNFVDEFHKKKLPLHILVN